MRWPPPVRVSLSPSMTASTAIALLALATSAVVSMLPADPAAAGLAIVAIGVWAFDRIQVVA
ncbi:MAG TPA: hypothetical protein VLB44_09780, partial [Kofleriaceae bacterium]|nr:hypothetical protein [Kofleriaceae bacterium]